MASTSVTSPDTLVTLKINIDGGNRRFKLPLRDLGASTLPDKLRFLLAIPPGSEACFERYSDSAAAFVVLDPNNASVYKQLYRAAKAKLKLRLKVTVKDKVLMVPKPATVEDEEPTPASTTEERAFPFQAPPSTASQPPKVAVRPSVADIQRSFEGLLVNKRNIGAASSASAATSSTCCAKPASKTEITMPTRSKMSIKCPLANKSGTEIPITRGAAARDEWFAQLSAASQVRHDAIRAPPLSACSIFTVYCNNCNDAIPDAHYHCSTCDDGDFDLCQKCVDNGVSCNGSDHWLIKRFVNNGKVINSTTQTLAPRVSKTNFSESKATLVNPEPEHNPIQVLYRTCNCCIEEMSEESFVNCMDCEDYDLCMTCHINNVHGHNPKHNFQPAVKGTHLSSDAKALLPAGRNVGHNAVCDGCDKYIFGVRHKCLDCPDWDFCSTCILDANYIHPRHRFVPIYDALHDTVAVSRAFNTKSRHHGIYCDGPLCNNDGHHSYIKGDRYKCAVCDDTDFCASCEASPANPHNKTHPLIKFKTPVRNCSVTTMGDHENGMSLPTMGDRRGRTTSKATETTPATSTNAATQVHTIAELRPTETVKEKPVVKEEKPVEVKFETVKVEQTKLKVESESVVKTELVAHFIRDAVADGTVFPTNNVFEQTWYLRNGGNTSWPAGCSVKFVGGDNMCAVDPDRSASVHELVRAAESTTCYTEVAAGQEVGFTVLMRTPNRAGNFISYWRLTGPDGEKFGHRLWCDVAVKDFKPIKEEPKEGTKDVSVETELKVEAQGSQMIFPKLENESPATSVHQEASASASAPLSDAQSEVDEFEDFVDETLEDEETDDGFLTDEEYDILDASDEEYLAQQAKTARK